MYMYVYVYVYIYSHSIGQLAYKLNRILEAF